MRPYQAQIGDGGPVRDGVRPGADETNERLRYYATIFAPSSIAPGGFGCGVNSARRW